MNNKNSLSKYEKMPKKFGWKYEFYGGEIHASPWEIVIVYDFKLNNLSALHSNFPVSDIEKDDLDNFVTAWLSAYRNADEFYGYSEAEIKDRAVELFNRATSDRGNSNALMSGIVKGESGDILGGIIVTKTKSAGNPLLQGLFCIPEYQRKGIATILLSHVVNRLSSMGYKRLISFCQLSNEIGNRWHRKSGFKELPDMQIAGMRHYYFSKEMDRLEVLNELNKEKREYLLSEIDKWQKEVIRLQSIEETDGYEAVHPLLSDVV